MASRPDNTGRGASTKGALSALTPLQSFVYKRRVREPVASATGAFAFSDSAAYRDLPGWQADPFSTRVSPMANTTSAKKMTRKIAKRTEVNRARRSRMRTFIRKVEEAITGGDHTVAMQALQAAQPEMMRAAQKGIVHKNTASRRVSRLAMRIKALSATA
jgi:small subunit ribosomal protein S20